MMDGACLTREVDDRQQTSAAHSVHAIDFLERPFEIVRSNLYREAAKQLPSLVVGHGSPTCE
jgi:hypothetical protein